VWWGAEPSAGLVRREDLNELQACLDRNRDEQLLLVDSRKWEEKAGDANRTLLLIAVLLVVATSLSTWQAWKGQKAAKKSEDAATTAAREEQAQRKNAEIQGKIAVIQRNVSDALRTLRTNPKQSITKAKEAVEMAEKSDLSSEDMLRETEDTLRQAVQASRLVWAEQVNDVRNIAFSRDGSRLAAVSMLSEKGERTGKVTVKAHLLKRSPDDKRSFDFVEEPLRFPPHETLVNDMAFVEEEEGRHEYLVIACDNGCAIRWDLTASEERKFTHGEKGVQVWAVAISPNRKHLATADTDGRVYIWNFPGKSKKETFEAELNAHKEPIMQVAYRPGKGMLLLATASMDGTVKLWNPSTRELVHSFTVKGWVHSVAFNQAGTRLVAAGLNRTVIVWDIEKLPGRPPDANTPGFGNVSFRLTGHRSAVTSVAFSHDDKFIATASKDDTTKVWDARSGRELFSLPGTGTDLPRAVWSPKASLLATCGSGEVKVWDVSPSRGPYLVGQNSLIMTFAISSDQKRLATASLDNTVLVWDASSGAYLYEYQSQFPVYSVAFSPDTKRLAVAGGNGFATVLDLPDVDNKLKFSFSLIDRKLQEKKAHVKDIWQIAFSKDGRRLATASFDQTAKVWDASPDSKEDRLTHKLERNGTEEHENRVHSVAFSSDRKTLATGHQRGDVHVWDISRDKEPKHLKQILSEGSGTVRSVTFSGNGWLAAGNDGGVVQLCKPPGYQVVRTIPAHTATVLNLTFNEDGSRLATASADKTAVLWDVATGKRLHDVRGHEGPVPLVAFSQDSQLIHKEILITATNANEVETGHVYKNILHREDLLFYAAHAGEYYRRWELQKLR
jgi:WD40 repeat protein